MSAPKKEEKAVEQKPGTNAMYTKQGYVGMHAVKDKLPFKIGDRLLVVVNGDKVIIRRAK